MRRSARRDLEGEITTVLLCLVAAALSLGIGRQPESTTTPLVMGAPLVR